MIDYAKISESVAIKIGNRYIVVTDYNDKFEGVLEVIRDGNFQFRTDDGGFRNARFSKCKLQKVEESK